MSSTGHSAWQSRQTPSRRKLLFLLLPPWASPSLPVFAYIAAPAYEPFLSAFHTSGSAQLFSIQLPPHR